METTFLNIIKEFNEGSSRKILGRFFFNEHIVKKNLTSVIIIKTEFTNCKFNDINFNGSYLKNCTFKICQVKNCAFTKKDFYTSTFKHCHLQEIKSSWSYFNKYCLHSTDFTKIHFTGAIIDNLNFIKQEN